jgi:hypothetical protein
MHNFEFDIELLIPVVEARPVLWDKMDYICKDRIETSKALTEGCCLQEEFQAVDVKKSCCLIIVRIY